MEFNESFVTEVVVGTVLSPTRRVKASRGHVLFSPKKAVITRVVFMFMEPEKACCLRQRGEATLGAGTMPKCSSLGSGKRKDKDAL